MSLAKMITIKTSRRTDLGTSSGARDDAGGSAGGPRDMKSLPGNLFGTTEPETEHSKTKKRKRKFGRKRIYQLGIDVPEVTDNDTIPTRSA